MADTYMYVRGTTLDGQHVEGVFTATVRLDQGISTYLVCDDMNEWLCSTVTTVADNLQTFAQRALLQRFSQQD